MTVADRVSPQQEGTSYEMGPLVPPLLRTFLRPPPLDLSLALWAEILRFTSARLSAQADFLQRLSECEDWPAVFQRQQAFMDAAFADYVREGSDLVAKARERLAA